MRESNLRNQYAADYMCRAHYASPMPEQRMRDDYSDSVSVSEWGYARPMEMKKRIIPRRRPYEAHVEPESWKESIPQAYPKPGQDIPAEIYSNSAAAYSSPRQTTHSPEERFFKKANHIRLSTPNRTSGASLHPHYRGDPTRMSSAATSNIYRKTRSYMPSAAPSEQQYASMGGDKHRATAEYRRKETERHLLMQAQQYGYATKENDSTMDVETVHPKDESRVKYIRTLTSFSNSDGENTIAAKSVSEDTECTRSSSRTYEGSVNSKKEEMTPCRTDGSAEPQNQTGDLKVELLNVKNYPGIDIKPEGEHIASEKDVSSSVEQKHMEKPEDAEYDWEVLELPSYFEMLREVMPRTLFSRERETNRPNSKWYSYDCRARMYIRQQPNHAPIQTHHVSPPTHLTKEEFYEAIGE